MSANIDELVMAATAAPGSVEPASAGQRKAVALFGDKGAKGVVLIRTFDEYKNGYTDDKGRYVKGYKDLVADLVTLFPLGVPIVGEKAEKDFISLWGLILKVRNILSAFALRHCAAADEGSCHRRAPGLVRPLQGHFRVCELKMGMSRSWGAKGQATFCLWIT